MGKKIRLAVNPKTGQVATIYSPESQQIMAGLCSEVTTSRASHVEPGSGLRAEAINVLVEKGLANDNGVLPEYRNTWFADLTPSFDGVVLGPFSVRDDAIRAELEYLNKRLPELTDE